MTPTVTHVTIATSSGVWLCGTLLLAERRMGYVIILLGSLLGLGTPFVHLRGSRGVASGSYFFIWTLIALGVTTTFSLILAVRGLWSFKRGRQQGGSSPPVARA